MPYCANSDEYKVIRPLCPVAAQAFLSYVFFWRVKKDREKYAVNTINKRENIIPELLDANCIQDLDIEYLYEYLSC